MRTHTKSGNPTAYGYACGHDMRVTVNERRIRLYREGHVYHVRTHYKQDQGANSWWCFDSLPEARKAFRREVGLAKGRVKGPGKGYGGKLVW